MAEKQDCYPTGYTPTSEQLRRALEKIDRYLETDADAHAEDVWHHRYAGQAEHAD